MGGAQCCASNELNDNELKDSGAVQDPAPFAMDVPDKVTDPAAVTQTSPNEDAEKAEREEKVEQVEKEENPNFAEDTLEPAKAPIEAPPPPAPPKIDAEYSVTLDRTYGGNVGLDLNKKDLKVLIIESINGGLVGKWNAENPSNMVQVKDRIVEVNGIRGDRVRLLDECKKKQILELKLLRGTRYSVTLDRKYGATVGMSLNKKDNTSLIVQSITGGLVGKWNAANPSNRIEVNDRIVEVNGIRGDMQQLLQECKQYKLLELTMVRA